ncbi:MAG: EAL domain-containing protein [Candidatus Competibacterales bacterium]
MDLPTTTPSQRYFPPGARLFCQGELGDCAYLIDRGRVEISVDSGAQRRLINILGPGEVLGEMALIEGVPRAATAVALEATVVTVIGAAQIRERLDRADPVLALLLGALSHRLRHTLHPHTVPLPTYQHPAAVERIHLESELQRGLDRGEFVLYFQPISRLKDGHLAGFEALVRWRHPQRGLLTPGDFIDVAEDSGLIVPLGRWITAAAVAALERLDVRGEGLFMGINVSAVQLAHPQFVDDLEAAVRHRAMDRRRLKLEITETALLGGDQVHANLAACRERGFALALDDFGTGYCSLDYLRRLPVHTLKLDRSFVAALPEDPRSVAVVRALVTLAADLAMEVVAEGIEASTQWHTLADLACHYGQGYWVSPPVDETVAGVFAGRPAPLLRPHTDLAASR